MRAGKLVLVRRFAIAGLAFFSFGLADSATAIEYTVTDLGPFTPTSINESAVVGGFSGNGPTQAVYYDSTLHTLAAAGFANSANGVNDSGHVSGVANGQAFIYDGVMHSVGGPGSWGGGINNSDQLTGFATFAAPHHAFFYDGVMHDLGTLGGDTSEGWAINESGHVAGVSLVAPNSSRGFFYDGTMHDLGSLGGGTSQAYGLNDLDQVVGQASLAGGERHAFLYDGTMHDLGTVGTESRAYGINNSGTVVGYIDTNTGLSAFVYKPALGMVDLNTLIDPLSGWSLLAASAINDSGQIVGLGFHGAGDNRAFLLTPAPEPAALVLFVLGGAACLLLRQKIVA